MMLLPLALFTTDVVTEDVGTGMLVLDISFMSPEDFGYDMSRFASGALTAVNANLGLHAPPSRLVCFTHQVRPIPPFFGRTCDETLRQNRVQIRSTVGPIEGAIDTLKEGLSVKRLREKADSPARERPLLDARIRKGGNKDDRRSTIFELEGIVSKRKDSAYRSGALP
jgi:DAPG hydrolase PhiG domain